MTMADLAASSGRGSVTVSFNCNFVSSAAPVGDLLVATATCIREGGKLSFLQGSVVSRNDAGDRPEVTVLTFSAVMSRILAKQPDAKL
jgi:acyl-coenzyme A thioesterase PaaI-like protein